MSKVHRFICANEHDFFVDLRLPAPLNEVATMLQQLQCPICCNDELRLHFASDYSVIQH